VLTDKFAVKYFISTVTVSFFTTEPTRGLLASLILLKKNAFFKIHNLPPWCCFSVTIL
jgi:hypothetical protein